MISDPLLVELVGKQRQKQASPKIGRSSHSSLYDQNDQDDVLIRGKRKYVLVETS